MKINKIITGAITVILGSILFGCSKTKPLEYKIEKWNNDRIDIVQMLQSKDCEISCVVSNGETAPLVIPSKYVVTYEMEATAKKVTTNGYGYNNTLEKSMAYIHDINTLQVVKEIDVKKCMEPYMNDYQVVGVIMELREKARKYYLEKRVWERYSEEELREKTSESDTEIKEIWIDIETEETQIYDRTDEKYSSENIWMLTGTLIVRESISEKARVRNDTYLKKGSIISIPTKDLPPNNKKLYGLFPELKNIPKKDGEYVHVFFTNKTTNLEALTLMLDDNEDIDFNVLQPDSEGYYGHYRKEGKMHYITKEEYEQFQKEYWDYRAQYREEYGIVKE